MGSVHPRQIWASSDYGSDPLGAQSKVWKFPKSQILIDYQG
jgi:hypothetical protein